MPTARMAPLLRHMHKLAGADGRLSDAELLESFRCHHDGDAFRVLVQRHGPMVLGVCRRALGPGPDCEDAFQATFLVLVRKAKRIRRPELLGNWLFGAARRIALKAKARSIRDAQRRRPLDEQVASPVCDTIRHDDASQIIDDAVARLPAKYRIPIVLCYLQGQSQADAATRLGCAVSTVSTRIARAKARLRTLLIRQGMTAASAMHMAALSPQSLTVSVPAQLALATRAAAIATASGTGAIPLSILALTKGLGDTMILHSWKLVGVALLTLSVGGTMTGMTLGWLPIGTNMGPTIVAAAPLEVAVTDPVENLPSDDPPKLPDDPERPAHVVMTENFVVSGAPEDEAKLIGKSAEEWRRKFAEQWLRAELPVWTGKCPITVELMPKGSRGATTFQFNFPDKPYILKMRLTGSLAGILSTALPREVMHTVLASHFGKPIPRWADEGVAVFAADFEAQARYDAAFERLLQKGNVLTMSQMFATKDYNERDNPNTLHAQGLSVVSFLVGRRDRPTFVQFLYRGMEDGWDTAVKDVYDFASIEAMETAWLKDLEQRRKSAADAQPFIEPDTTPPNNLPPVTTPPSPARAPDNQPPATTSPPPAPITDSSSSATIPLPFDSQPQAIRAVIDDEGRLVLKSFTPKPDFKPTLAKPSPAPSNSPRREYTRRFSILDVRGFVVKNHRLDEVELRRFAGLLRAERVVIVMYVDGPREELENLLLIAQDDTIVLLLPRPRPPATGGP
jgi:RNA polymerase sigma factor (sigma-70 family)